MGGSDPGWVFAAVGDDGAAGLGVPELKPGGFAGNPVDGNRAMGPIGMRGWRNMRFGSSRSSVTSMRLTPQQGSFAPLV